MVGPAPRVALRSVTLLPAKQLHLWPHQVGAQTAVRAAWADQVAGPLIVLATGAGKTVTAMGLVADALERGERVVWVAHRRELVSKQPINTLRAFWPQLADRAGVVQGDRLDVDARAVFASVQTLGSGDKLERVLAHGPIDLLVVDEAHRSGAPEYQRVIKGLEARRRLGLSATPERDDGVDLSEDWEIVASFGIDPAIKAGYLKPPYAVHVPVKVHLDAGSEDMAEAGAKLLQAGIVDATVEAMSRPHEAIRLPWRDDKRTLSAEGRSALVFTATVEQAQLTAEALTKAGRVARWVSGSMGKRDRDRITAGLCSGAIQDGCNAAVYIEGTDIPRISCVVIARPCRSRVLFVQAVGRGLRLHETAEECLVIDLAGATEIHSLVAAPVLIGESQCPKSPNRVHLFREDEGKGACEHCGTSVPCWAALEAGKPGGRHLYDRGVCRHCGAVQCPESPESQHVWVPEIDAGVARTRCIWCDALGRNPLGGLAKEKRIEKPASAAWTRLPGLVPATWAVDLGEQGAVFVVERGELRQGAHMKKHCQKPRWMPPAERRLTIAWVDDLVRRASKKWDARKGAEVYGGHGRNEIDDWRRWAMARAVKAGIAGWEE